MMLCMGGSAASARTRLPLAVCACLGALGALSAISLGWLVLGPVMLVVLALCWTRFRGDLLGVAVAAGGVLLWLGAMGLDRRYPAPFVVMGTSLLVFGVLGEVRRVWLTPM
jgi:hypothetical protein